MPQRLLIQNGTVYDGTGAPPTESDILIENGKVARVAPRGTIKAAGANKIDAKGMWETPGFLDTHTHYAADLALAPGRADSVRHGGRNKVAVIQGVCKQRC